ncbi:DUF4097 domain-containing protein [Solirubrobacter phytolaccae]|uniref:DUF4097 domain-containing protein n=1 Tax=Solirubrobacter phytolaccae TaxID=1404360 RepID=A0A9X3S6R6_9ACTN|nr:DUF4097 family beta strand repeat-containing protein [Solirubrobacter phytolaccae]MDA0179433.1 DUF4097 domain-containing protein [Solirubrobacter phytolaccae]
MAISALLVVGGAIALFVASIASTKSTQPTFEVVGAVETLTLDVDDSDVVVVGGGRRDTVEVQRTQEFAFGHAPRIEKHPAGSAFALRARCPVSLLGPCSVAFRVVVPDNVALDIRTADGDVSLRGYRGSARVSTGAGRIEIAGYCGNSLDARAGAGEIAVQAACAPPRMSLRTGSGAIRAVMPPGRYDLDAESTSGEEAVRGITARDDAPYVVQVLSASGDVAVEGRS